MNDTQNSRKALNTLLAIICVSLVAFTGIFIIGIYDMNGEKVVWIVGIAIVAVAGLGGYEIREQFRNR